MNRQKVSTRVSQDTFDFLTTQNLPVGRVIDSLVELAKQNNNYEKLTNINNAIGVFLGELRWVQSGTRRSNAKED